jgi:hypothetical protein
MASKRNPYRNILLLDFMGQGPFDLSNHEESQRPICELHGMYKEFNATLLVGRELNLFTRAALLPSIR